MSVGVTEVLDFSAPPQLVSWFKRNSEAKCNKIGEETARIGKAVDLLIQQDIKEGGYVTPEDDEGVMKCLSGWEALKISHPNFVPGVKEMQVEVKAFGLIGYFDFFSEERDGWGITDLKCTSSIKDKYWIQEAQYARMLMDVRGISFPTFVRTIRLSREDGAFEFREIRNPRMIRKLMRMFDGYLEVYYSGKIIADYFREELEDQLLGGF